MIYNHLASEVFCMTFSTGKVSVVLIEIIYNIPTLQRLFDRHPDLHLGIGRTQNSVCHLTEHKVSVGQVFQK